MTKFNSSLIKTNMVIGALAILFTAAMDSGDNRVNRDMVTLLQQEGTWKKMSKEESSAILRQALRYASWEGISKEDARATLTDHIDKAKIPHGDLAVPSKTVHSKRHIISQWQRSAAGAIVAVLGRDGDGDLCVALGPQRGKMAFAQGYMEVPLPNEDLTGLQKQGYSRINSKTGEPVKADTCLEDAAVREVREELGLDITRGDLALLAVGSGVDANHLLPTVVAIYGVLLNQTPSLKTLDDEFPQDDMQEPKWYKIREIKRGVNGNYYVPGNDFPIERMSVLRQAIDKLVPKGEVFTIY
jgi:8-oxo-dGTP pyrophosphatase MutT (NUDIX family)